MRQVGKDCFYSDFLKASLNRNNHNLLKEEPEVKN